MIGLIIPMYNNEKTIETTLKSVVNQTHPFSEVIIVDNGSNDQSEQIVKKYCLKYPYIRLVQCLESGVSFARNKGIDEMKSAYLSFLDADDVLDLKYVEIMENFISENSSGDIYHFNFKQQFKNGIIKTNPYFLKSQKCYRGETFLTETLRRFSFEAKHMVWTFIFKKQFLDTFYFRFDGSVPIFEDILFLHQVWKKAQHIFVLDVELITYLYVETSLTNTLYKQRVIDSLRMLKDQLSTTQQQRYLKQLSMRCLTMREFVEIWNHSSIYVVYKTMYTIQKIVSKIKKRGLI